MARKLGDWLTSYLDFVENSEPPEMFKLWCAISVIASALERKCYLSWGSLTFYPNMYVVLVAPSGKARKGTAMGPALRMLEEIGVKLAAEAITREALIRTLAESTNSTPNEEDGTIDNHCSLTVWSPELTVFLGHQNFQLMSDLTDWYDCRSSWTYRTKNQGTDIIKGVWVNLLGATTPDLIRSALPMDAIGGGLTSRMIFVYEPRRGKLVPAPFLTNKDRDLRADLMNDLEDIRMMKGMFRFSQKFVENWIDWYTRQEDNPPFKDSRFDGYIERRPNHVMKLAMVCSASRSGKMILEEADLERAITILTETEKKMPFTFSGMGRSSAADVLSSIMSEIAGRGDEGIEIKELMQLFYRDADSQLMDKILQQITSMGFATRVTRQGGIYITHNKNCQLQVDKR